MINLGLIGYPIEHSLSPIIHQAALDFCDLPGNYFLYSVLSNDLKSINDLLNQVRGGEIIGLNVTIPFKQIIIPLLDELSPTAKAIGAVNTVLMQNGKLTGTNTDADGFSADLRKFIPEENTKNKANKNALVLGGGGSARAIIYALVNQGWNITFATRRPQNAGDFLSLSPNLETKISNIEFEANAIRSLNFPIHLIINATPVGMSPQIENSPWPAELALPQTAVIYDLIYSPKETKFVLDAKAAGVPAYTGMGMLVEQAALAFELWTGRTVPRDILFDVVEEK